MRLNLSKTISNQDLGEIFGFIAEVLAMRGEDRFRIRAYQSAAVVIEQQPQPLREMFLTNPDFDNLPGIGKILNQKLVELFTTGDIKALQEYVADVPEGIFILSKVPGIGAKRASALIQAFQLQESKSIMKDVLTKAKAGEVQKLDGFGAKSEQQLINQLENYVEKKRLPHAEALAVADSLKAKLDKCEHIVKVEVLGSLRRHSETVGDIDLGIAVSDLDKVKDYIAEIPDIKSIIASGEGLVRVLLQDGHQVDIKVAIPEEWGSFIQHFTGSKEHNIKLREHAIRQGKSLSEHGMKIKTENGEETKRQFASEEAFYNDLGFKWIPPQERLGGPELIAYKM